MPVSPFMSPPVVMMRTTLIVEHVILTSAAMHVRHARLSAQIHFHHGLGQQGVGWHREASLSASPSRIPTRAGGALVLVSLNVCVGMAEVRFDAMAPTTLQICSTGVLRSSFHFLPPLFYFHLPQKEARRGWSKLYRYSFSYYYVVVEGLAIYYTEHTTMVSSRNV